MKHYDVMQQSKEWFTLRMGKPTASEMDKIITPSTLKPSKQAYDYMCRLLAEWYLQEPFTTETMVYTTAMDRGIELEAEAVEFYTLTTGLATTPAGLCTDDAGTVAASPDRFSGEEGLLEIKCPMPPKMVSYLLAGEVPLEHRLQLESQLYVTGKAWVDFLAYGDKLPPLLLRVYPDPKVQAALEVALALFCSDLEAGKRKLEAMRL